MKNREKIITRIADELYDNVDMKTLLQKYYEDQVEYMESLSKEDLIQFAFDYSSLDEVDLGITHAYCDTCGKPMSEGYCLDDGETYYCSDECLFVNGYTPEERDKDYENGSLYWTTWEEDEDE